MKRIWALPFLILVLSGILLAIQYQELRKLQEENNTLHEQVKVLQGEKEKSVAARTVARQELEKLSGLVRIDELDDTIVLDLRYATDNNFTGETIYPAALALLQKGTAEKLVRANEEFQRYGYRIKIWDTYRPLSTQQILWNIVPDRRYVAHPENGSRHNRGAAVDITLVDEQGNELTMPTGFDDFTNMAARSFPHIPPEARVNMELLTEVMVRNGFTVIDSEWWHFDDSDWPNYPLLDVSLEAFAK